MLVMYHRYCSVLLWGIAILIVSVMCMYSVDGTTEDRYLDSRTQDFHIDLAMIADEEAEDEEESIQMKALRVPTQPSADEIQQHNIAHCPFRSWCRACVAGRGRSLAHRNMDYEDSHIYLLCQ